MNTIWNTGQLKAYIMLYISNIMNINNISTNTYINLLGVNKFEYFELTKEFNRDNDYQSIEKILSALKTSSFTRDQLQAMFIEIKSIFSRTEKGSTRIVNNVIVNFERILIQAA